MAHPIAQDKDELLGAFGSDARSGGARKKACEGAILIFLIFHFIKEGSSSTWLF